MVEWEELGQHAKAALGQAKTIKHGLPYEQPILPVFIAYTADMKVNIIGLQFSSDAEKDLAAQAVKNWNLTHGPIVAYIYVIEGWVSVVQEKDMPPKVRPSEDPNRGEAIYIEYAMPGKIGTLQSNFALDNTGKLIFEDIETKPVRITTRAKFYEIWGSAN